MRQSGGDGDTKGDRPLKSEKPRRGSGVEEIPGIHKSPRTPGVRHSHLSYGPGVERPSRKYRIEDRGRRTVRFLPACRIDEAPQRRRHTHTVPVGQRRRVAPDGSAVKLGSASPTDTCRISHFSSCPGRGA
ncbi:DUF6083 domain-containing protein [Streptomyces sp. NPDC020898]|uniref:DUF6083 domain-containing protein n=1 Tax=Streptomyces sp. NPDC020898 TaxID=3365101 RepID=UPI00378B53AE